jgi:hypothetical protein
MFAAIPTISRRRMVSRLPHPWTNGPITLFHGTHLAQWRSIESDGVRVDRGRTGLDFGPGFYTTANRLQAVQWASELGLRRNDRATVIWARFDRDELARLECLFFVRGHHAAEDFWSFVHHCRAGAATHARAESARPFYDVVVGPVSRNHMRRSAYHDMDQISFHTPVAQDVLNRVPWRTL